MFGSLLCTHVYMHSNKEQRMLLTETKKVKYFLAMKVVQ